MVEALPKRAEEPKKVPPTCYRQKEEDAEQKRKRRCL
jgi:hypothetical protein